LATLNTLQSKAFLPLDDIAREADLREFGLILRSGGTLRIDTFNSVAGSPVCLASQHHGPDLWGVAFALSFVHWDRYDVAGIYECKARDVGLYSGPTHPNSSVFVPRHMASPYSTSQRNWPTTQISLLERISDQEDDVSWENFVRIYAPLISRYCRRRGLQESDANDVVQDVLLQVSRDIREFKYDAQRGRFRNWLGTVTHRAMSKHISKASRAGGGEGSALDVGQLENEISRQPLDGTWVEAFNAHVFREAIERLRPHFDHATWQAFQQTFRDERPSQEVADELGRTIGWVYQAKSQVVRRLRDEIVYLAEDSVLLNLEPRT
jgi:RNA polymerase sigma-70 factor, ECF subfamily